MKQWIEEVKINSSKTVKLVLVGNKVDLIDAENKEVEGLVNF
jgi:GTPase SAR1 family protein